MPRNYVRSKPHNKITPKQIETLRKLHAADVSVTSIAAALGLSRVHVYRLIRKYCS
jgi:predicted DNA-binding protein YlxM (UPF0122 family)